LDIVVSNNRSVSASGHKVPFGSVSPLWTATLSRVGHEMIEELCAENNQHFDWHIPVAETRLLMRGCDLNVDGPG
jgi:hypothetical protein